MNLRQIRKDVEKLRRETNAARLAEAERSGNAFEIFVELCRQGGINLSREQLQAQFEAMESVQQRLVAEGRIVPSQMTTLDGFIALCREGGTDLNDEQLKAQFETMKKEKTAHSRTAFN
jgi:uncharacterized protein (DUF2344 family)